MATMRLSYSLRDDPPRQPHARPIAVFPSNGASPPDRVRKPKRMICLKYRVSILYAMPGFSPIAEKQA
jgi:hypothetical protein